jgi:nitroreductase
MYLTSGEVRDRLVAAMLEHARARPPVVPQLPESHAHLRRQLGAVVYGAMGIARHDSEARQNAVLRNWEFFRAPVGGIVCMHKDLGTVDSMGVGMFLQTLVLALTSRGLGTCVQVSIAGYPEVVREQLDIPDELTILCGLAVGYADPNFAGNEVRVGRDAVEEHVAFLDG